MSKYRKVDIKIWHDEKFKILSADSKYMFLYLLTSPHSTAWGAYVIDDLYIQADIGFSPQKIKACWKELGAIVSRCHETNLVCFKNWFRYNPPVNQKSAIACIRGILDLPKSVVLSRYCEKSEWVSEQLANLNLTTTEKLDDEQEQEQEQEQEHEHEEILARSANAQSELQVPLNGKSQVFCNIPLIDKTKYPITEDQVDKFQELYPAINVRQELRNIVGWNEANKNKRKTPRGILNHVNGWLARKQDRGVKNQQASFGTGKFTENNVIAAQKWLERRNGNG